MTAGQGPRYPEIPSASRWESSNGTFALGGGSTVSILPDQGEQLGDPVRVDLTAGYSVTGGTGAGVGWGHTDTGYDIAVQVYGPVGTPTDGAGQGTLFSGQRSAKLINSSPTSQITDFSESRSKDRTFEARIGDAVKISTSLFGDAATWQGGSTGLARGAVTGGVSYHLEVTSYKPDLETFSIVRKEFPYFKYSVSQELTREPKIGLFWSEDITYSRDTDPLADQLRTGHREAGTHDILFNRNLPGWDPKYQYLLFVIDPYNEIAEVDEAPNGTEATGNDVKYICVLEQPDIKLEVPSNAMKGIPYWVQVDVTNNSLIMDRFNIQLSHQSSDQLPNYVHTSSTLGVRTATISANRFESFEFQVMDSWAWVDQFSPLLGDLFGDAVEDNGKQAAAKAFVKLILKDPSFAVGSTTAAFIAKSIYDVFFTVEALPRNARSISAFTRLLFRVITPTLSRWSKVHRSPSTSMPGDKRPSGCSKRRGRTRKPSSRSPRSAAAWTTPLL